MILTVTLNAALDVTYDVDRLVPHGSHRVGSVRSRAGGKGVNVARVLAALGHDVLATGLAGGPTGALVRAELAAAGLAEQLMEIAGDTRRTVTVVSEQDGDATVFNEPGPVVTPEEWQGFLTRYRKLVSTVDTVVLSGSMPPGVPVNGYHELIGIAASEGARTVLDTSGEPLLAALEARPDVVKPNAVELREVTGVVDTHDAAQRLRAAGAVTVVASMGPDGLLAATPSGTWRAAPASAVTGNPTGAGDACVAALSAGLAAGADWGQTLVEAVAVSAAAVAAPLAGEFDAAVRNRLLGTTRLWNHG